MTLRLSTVLAQAERAEHVACRTCFWKPTAQRRMAFGTSCAEHTHATDEPALAVSIAADPGGTTPEKTKRLCPVHNSVNGRDGSARHAFDLWRAAISLQPRTHPYSDPLMRRTYFTNALLHGVANTDPMPDEERARLKKRWKDAAASCAHVLREQLIALQPKIVMVSGERADHTLNQIAPGRWTEATSATPPHRIVSISGISHSVQAFRLIHAGEQGTNLVAAPQAKRLFTTTQAQERFVGEQVHTLPSPTEAMNLLARCRQYRDNPYRGMMLHLVWWIAVGKAIRAAAAHA